MIGRAVMLLLAVVLLLAMIGKWTTPRVPPRPLRADGGIGAQVPRLRRLRAR